jgi:hypothetical protein
VVTLIHVKVKNSFVQRGVRTKDSKWKDSKWKDSKWKERNKKKEVEIERNGK